MSNILYSFHASHDNNSFFEGIFSKIQSITNESIITESSIILRSSATDDDYPLSNILKDNGKYWRTTETKVPNQYIEIDFKKNRVRLDYIHFYFCESDVRKEYALYGSISSNNKEVFIKNLTSSSKQSSNTSNVVRDCISVLDNRFWNKIKIVAKGQRGYGEYRFVIHRLELTGSFIIYKDLIQQSCRSKIYHSRVLLNSIFLLCYH